MKRCVEKVALKLKVLLKTRLEEQFTKVIAKQSASSPTIVQGHCTIISPSKVFFFPWLTVEHIYI